MLRRPGSSWGIGALFKGLTSVMVLRMEESAGYSLPPPTKIQIKDISNIKKIILNIFYLSPDDTKSDMKRFFADSFPLLPGLGLSQQILSCYN